MTAEAHPHSRDDEGRRLATILVASIVGSIFPVTGPPIAIAVALAVERHSST